MALTTMKIREDKISFVDLIYHDTGKALEYLTNGSEEFGALTSEADVNSKIVTDISGLNIGHLSAGVFRLQRYKTGQEMSEDELQKEERVFTAQHGNISLDNIVISDNSKKYLSNDRTTLILPLHMNNRDSEYQGDSDHLVIQIPSGIPSGMATVFESYHYAPRLAYKNMEANFLRRIISFINHEVGKPIDSIVNFSGYAIEDVSNGENKAQILDYLNRVLRNGKMADNVIKEFTECANTGHRVTRYDRINLDELTRQAKDTGSDDIRGKKIELLYAGGTGNDNLSYSNDTTMYGDSFKVWTIVRNLVSNAGKYTLDTKDPILINISHGFNDSKQRFGTTYSVLNPITYKMDESDIASLNQQRVRRLDNEARDRVSGTGIGGVICHVFTEAHGGLLKYSLKSIDGKQYLEASAFFPDVQMK